MKLLALAALLIVCLWCPVWAQNDPHHGNDSVTVGQPSASGDSSEETVSVGGADDKGDMDMSHNSMNKPGKSHGSTDNMKMDHDSMGDMSMDMGDEDLIGISHGRHASGTSWMPDSTPTYMKMWDSGPWMMMLHGAAFVSYINMSGARGDRGFFAPNWIMLHTMRPSGNNAQIEFSGMFSLDPVTVGGAGYPLLFQTGETWNDLPLMDHQHPHNAFSELSMKYKWRLSCDSAAFIYVAPVGEPALGPPSFMHRTLALDYPLSPIGHHWQDSTHIAYGVVTGGIQSREWQLEGSVFNGQEPGENRYAIDSPTFDSYSGRLTWNPGKNVSMQVSKGRLHGPESLHPDVDVDRTTASIVYNQDLGCERNWQTAVIWGRNAQEGANYDSLLMESSLKQDGSWSPFFRIEQVEKNAEELVLPSPQFAADETFTVRQATVGATVDLNNEGDWQWGLGAAYTFNMNPAAIDSVYGSDPSGWTVFLRAHPRKMEHSGHEGHAADSHAGNGDATGDEPMDHEDVAPAEKTSQDDSQTDTAMPEEHHHLDE